MTKQQIVDTMLEPVLAKLEANGYITIRGEGDARVIKLTEKGAEAVKSGEIVLTA